MWAVEAPINDDNFGTALSKEKESVRHFGAAVVATVWHGVYFSLAGWTSKTEEFAPKSVAGRILGISQAVRAPPPLPLPPRGVSNRSGSRAADVATRAPDGRTREPDAGCSRAC